VQARLESGLTILLEWCRARIAGHTDDEITVSSATGTERTPTHSHEDGGAVSHLLESLTVAAARRPGVTLTFVALVTLVSLVITLRFMTFKTNRSDLIDPHQAFHQRWMKFVENFGDDSDVVVVIEGDKPDQIRAVMDRVGSRLDAEKDLFARVLYKVDPTALRHKALQYLNPVDLERAQSRLEMYAPILEGHWNRAGLESYCRRLTDHIQLNTSQHSTNELQSLLTQSSDLIQSMLGFLQNPGDFKSPWPEVISASAFPHMDVSEPQYQLTPSGKMGFVLALPRNVSTDFSGTSRSLARMNEIVADARAEFSDVKIGLTGIPVLEADEMKRSQLDMGAASVIAFVGVLLISLIGFRGFRHPLMSMTMIAVGIAWSMGYTTLAVGHLNILSMSFATILIGVGDYGTHYVAAYLEQRHHGLPLIPALAKTSRVVGTGIVTAAVTTALSFFAAAFTTFLGVAELGIIAGGGILLCAVATFAVLPPLITLADRKLEPRQLPTPFQGLILRRILRDCPGLVATMGVLLLIALGASTLKYENGHLSFRMRYDYNLLNMQAKGVESVELQKRIFEETNGSLLYALTMTDSPQNVRILKERFLELPTVSRVEDLASYLPSYPAEETGLLVQAIHARLSGLSELPRGIPQLDPSSIGGAFEALLTTLKSRPEPVAQAAAARVDALLNILDRMPLEMQMQVLSGYQQGMLMALHRQFQVLASISDPVPVSPEDFPEALRNRFVSQKGDWLLRIYPMEEIWDEIPLTNFVKDIRTVDPEVTGTPLQNFEAAHQIQQSYATAAIYAAAVIILVLLIDVLSPGTLVLSLLAPVAAVALSIVLMQDSQTPLNPIWLVSIYLSVAMIVASIFDFSKVRIALLALMPPLGGLLLMFGILSLMKVDLNPANLIVLPLIMGIGMDSGVYVIHDYRQQRGKYEITRSTVNAVTMTSLTTGVGFGSMMVAAHQGLVSLGMVLTIGVASCLFVSLVLLPAILTLMTRNLPDAESGGEGNADNDAEADQEGPVTFRVPLLPPSVALREVA